MWLKLVLLNSVENKIAILGLDNVGKTCLVRNLFSNSTDLELNPPRTHGIEVSESILKKNKTEKIPIMFIDVGGLKVFQVTLWLELIKSNIKGVIYIVDIQNRQRFDNDLSAFNIVVNNTTVPILVLGNKFDTLTDTENSMNTNHLFEILDIVEYKINDPFREIIVLPISVKNRINLDLVENWLYKTLTKKMPKNKS